MRRRLLFVCFLMCTAFLAAQPAAARPLQKAAYWGSWNVDITQMDTNANRFHVRETHTILITEGVINGGDRQIRLDRVTGIDNIIVREGNRTYRTFNNTPSNSCSGLGVVCLSIVGGEQVIYYNFFAAANTSEQRVISIDYDVRGALRSYAGGDQLWWVAIPDDRPATVAASRITVELPTGVQPQVYATYPNEWTKSGDGSRMTFIAPAQVNAGTYTEVRVQYPHNAAMAAPAWQAGFDASQRTEPLIRLGGVLIAFLIAILGPLLLFIRYLNGRRGLEAVPVPEYLTELPSADSPAVAGTLIDNSADTKDVLATMVDLASRGYLVIETTQERGLLGSHTKYTLHRTDKGNADLKTFENTMLAGLFAAGHTVDLSDLKDKFYSTLAVIKGQLYTQNVAEGYYKDSPEAVRNGWRGLGVFFIVAAGAIFFLTVQKQLASSPFQIALALIGAALGLNGFIFAIFAGAMPHHTPQGELEAKKWRAFKKYLGNLDKSPGVGDADTIFNRYIGYAVAFGLEKQFMRHFGNALTSMPTWYYPAYYYGSPYGYGRRNYSSGMAGFGDVQDGFSGGPGGGGLNQLSGNLSQGLQSLSNDLTGLLNSSASVLSSSPSSSSSGGFSGGGGGGGGSGGGSAGFH